MATSTVTTAKHATLSASTVDTVTFSDNVQAIEVVNRSGSAEIFFRLDGTSPTVAGDECYVLPAAAGAALRLGSQGEGTDQVKLISSGTPTYSVIGYTGGV